MFCCEELESISLLEDSSYCSDELDVIMFSSEELTFMVDDDSICIELLDMFCCEELHFSNEEY